MPLCQLKLVHISGGFCTAQCLSHHGQEADCHSIQLQLWERSVGLHLAVSIHSICGLLHPISLLPMFQGPWKKQTPALD